MMRWKALSIPVANNFKYPRLVAIPIDAAQNKEKLRQYFLDIACSAFKNSHKMTGQDKLRQIQFSLKIYQNLEYFVEEAFEKETK